MALHFELSIFKATYELLSVCTDLARRMPRDVKQLIGRSLLDRCFHMTVLIQRANIARDKSKDIDLLLEEVQVVEVHIRLARDNKYIAVEWYGRAIELTTSIGKMASRWKQATTPAA